MSMVAEDSISPDTAVGIVTEGGDGRRWFLGLAASFAAAAIVGIGFAFLHPILFPPSLAVRAREVVALPKDARVLSVKDEGGGQGDVWFTLPEPAGAGTREDEIWRLNGLPVSTPLAVGSATAAPAVPLIPIHRLGGKPVRKRPVIKMPAVTYHSPYVSTRTGNTITMEYSAGNRVTLEYDARTGRYHYRHHVDTTESG